MVKIVENIITEDQEEKEYQIALKKQKMKILAYLLIGMLIGTLIIGVMVWQKNKAILDKYEPCNYLGVNSFEWKCCSLCLKNNITDWQTNPTFNIRCLCKVENGTNLGYT